MLSHLSSHEAAIIELLRPGDILTLEQIHTRLSQLSWNELFHAVDALSRRGDIILRRRGVDYELQRGCRSEEGRATGGPSNAEQQGVA